MKVTLIKAVHRVRGAVKNGAVSKKDGKELNALLDKVLKGKTPKEDVKASTKGEPKDK